MPFKNVRVNQLVTHWSTIPENNFGKFHGINNHGKFHGSGSFSMKSAQALPRYNSGRTDRKTDGKTERRTDKTKIISLRLWRDNKMIKLRINVTSCVFKLKPLLV
ncbi:hypothetical protein DPMN_175757 [Dreissena polymorpha]|uniref:Uncharacterized protein n=1 Tax=Dreissena polymorpha TaxID=45954 RepID=A0A9D4E9N3_DREPO|nr:hypothetical protein DPMN_175757 [Dreissena polymorpha]